MKIFTLFKHLRKPVLFSLLVLFCLMMKSEEGSGQIVVQNPASPWIVPAGVTSIKVEVWGGGGAGGGTDATFGTNRGSGGGGGAYNTATWTVTGGQSYSITVGTGGTGVSGGDGTNGFASEVSGPAGTVIANPGTGGRQNGGLAGAGGTGGVFNGGNGFRATDHGGGGGGGAGNNGNAGNGTNTTGGAGGAGNPSVAPYIGGVGGDDQSGSDNDGNNGLTPGGGGSGSRSSGLFAGSHKGGNGGAGQVVITYYNSPTITSFSPNNACSGSGITITIQGTNFTNSSTVKINGITATTTFVNNTTLTAVLPSGATTGAISVSTAGGTATSATNFTVNPLPATTLVSGGGSFCATSATLTASGGSGGTIYFQGTTSNGTSTAIPSNTQIITASGTYYFRAQSSSGCWGPQGSATVNINAVPAATTVSGAGTFCGSTTVTASGGSGGTIYFQGMVSGGTSTSIASNSQTVTASGTYYFRSRSAAGCWGPEGSVVVSITPIPPAPTGSTPQLFCSNNNPTVSNLSATGSNIQWYSAATGSTALTSSTALIDGNHYYASQTVSGCESTTRLDVTVNVYDAVNIITQPDITQTSCSTFPADFTVAATGSGLTYQWYKVGSPDAAVIDDGNITGSTTDHLHIDQTSTTDAGTYYVMVSGTAPCTAVRSVDAVLNVNEEITVVTKPANQTVCEGTSSVTFTVVATGTGLSYQWKKGSTVLADDAHISGSGTASLTINNILLTDASTNYNVVITSPGGVCPQANPKNIKLTVNPLPTVNAGGAIAPICQGGATAALGGSFGGGATGAVWSDGLSGPNAGTFTNNTGSTPGIATYTASAMAPATIILTLTSVGGSCPPAATATKTLIVNPLPTVNAGGAIPAICQGATTIALGGSFGGGATSAVWSDGLSGPNAGTFTNNGGSTPGTATYTASATAPSSITLTLTSVGGSCPPAATATKTLTINPLPTVNAGGAIAPICQGGTTTALGGSFGGGATGAVWSDGLTGPNAGTFTNNGGSTPGTATYTASATAPASITLTLTTTGGLCNTTSTTKTLSVYQRATLTVVNSAICSGANAQINAATGSIVSWTRDHTGDVTGTASGGAGNINVALTNATSNTIPVTFTINTTTANGCTSTKTITIDVYGILTAPTVSASQILCAFSSPAPLTSTVPSGGTPVYNYTWQQSSNSSGPWTTAPGSTNSLSYTPPTPTAITYYQLQVTNSCGTVVSNIVQISTAADFGLTFSTGSTPSALCDGSSFHYSTSAISFGSLFGGRYIRYKWQSADAGYFTSSAPQPFGVTNSFLFFYYYDGDADFQVNNSSNAPATKDLWITPVILNSNGTTYCTLSTDYVTVTINPIPDISNTSASACSQTAFNYSPQNGVPASNVVPASTVYSWPAPVVTGGVTGGATGTNASSITGTLNNPTNTTQTATYTVTPKYNGSPTPNCTGNPFTLTVSVNPTPKVPSPSAITICSGTAPNFAPVNAPPNTIIPSGTTYTWTVLSSPAGITGASNQITGQPSVNQVLTNSATAPLTVSYSVTPATATCTGTAFTFNVTVNPTPTASISTAPTTICYNTGTTITFNGTPNTTISYTKNGTPATITLNSAGTATLNTGNITANTTYSLISVGFPSAPNCTQSLFGSVLITVNPIATATISAGTSPICSGQSSSIGFTGTPNTIVTYNNGTGNKTVTLSAGGSATVTVSPTSTTTYTLVSVSYPSTPSCTNTITGNATINISPDATAGTISGTPNIICIGATTTYTISGNSAAGDWSSSDNTVATVNASGIITGVNAGAADIVYTVSSGCNNPVQTTRQITVNPNVTAGTVSGSNPTVCINSITTLSSTGTSGGTWSIVSQTASATINPSSGVVNYGNSPGQVTFRYTVNNGCGTPPSVYTDYGPIQVFNSGVADPGDITGPLGGVCANSGGFNYSISPIPNATYYLWNLPSGWSITSGAGTNSITVSTSAAGGTVSVQVQGPCGLNPMIKTINITPSTAGSWLGITDNWNDPQNWCGGVPTAATNVTIPVVGTGYFYPVIQSANALANSVTISSGASLTMSMARTLDISSGFTNNGTFTAGDGTVNLATINAGSFTGNATTFNNLSITNNVSFNAMPTITGNFTINGGAVSGNSPTYGNGSTLVYNSTLTTYPVATEWTGNSTVAGVGVPQNVTIQNANNVSMPASDRGLAGNLTISAGSAFSLSTTNAKNLYIAGNWTNNGSFIHNSRTVTFNGSGDNTLTGNTVFYNVSINKIGGSLTFVAPNTTIDHDLTVSGGAMKSNTNTMVEFTGIGSLAGINDKSFYDLQINNASVMTITSGGVSINHDFINNGIYTYNGAARLTTFGGSGILQSMSGSAGSTTIFGKVVVGDNHPFSTGITLNASNDYTIQGGSISLSHSSTLNNTGNTVSFSGSAATISTTGTGIAYFHDAVTNVSLNPGSGISTFNNYLQINPGGSIAVNSPNYGGAATLIYNTATPSLTTGLEWNANSATPDLGQPFNVAIQNTNNIVMAGDRTVPGTLNIGSVNTLSLNDRMLTVNTAIAGAGSLTGSQLSGLTLGGTAPALSFTQTGFGNYLKTFTLNSGSNATLANALNIAGGNSSGYGILTANGNLAADNNLTLKSDASGTAMVGPSNGSIIGNVTTERFIRGRRAWRFLNMPFYSSGETLHSSWQENQQNTDLDYNHNQNNIPGFGTHITGNNDMSKGYDYNTTSNSSLKTWDIASQSWTTATPSTLTTNVTDHTGYCVFVRGSRAVNLALANNAPTDNTVLRSKGQLFERGVDLNTVTSKITDPAAINGKWVLFGNPFAATINVMDVLVNSNSTGIDKTQFSVWDPKLAGSSNAGAYVTYSDGIWAPDDGDNTNGSYSSGDLPLVQSGQAFMVEATGSNPQLEFKQANKVTSTQLDVFGIKARKIIPVIYTNLMTAQDTAGSLEMVDGVASGFGKDYAAANDPHNANKLWNFGENIALARNGKSMSIEFRPIPTESDTLFYNLYLKQQPYALKIFTKNPVGNLPARAWLIDKYLNKQIDVNLSDTLMYSFTPSSDTNSYRNRFMLVFKRTDSKTPAAQGIDPIKNNESIYVYPNPVIGKKVMVKFNNLIKGNYVIVLSDMKGRQTRNYKVQHAGTNTTYEFMLGASLASGNYSLTVYNEDTKKTFKVQIIIGR